MGRLWTFLTHLNSLAGPTIMLLYPLYASVRAIESPSKLDDEQWLAYWILYSFLTLLEMVAEPVLYWIPIWYQIKVAFVAWLVLPQFRGAAFIYERFVRAQLRKYGGGRWSGEESAAVPLPTRVRWDPSEEGAGRGRRRPLALCIHPEFRGPAWRVLSLSLSLSLSLMEGIMVLWHCNLRQRWRRIATSSSASQSPTSFVLVLS